MKKHLILCWVALMGLPLISFAQNEITKQYSGIESLDIEGGSLEVTYTGITGQKDVDIIAFLGPEEDREKDLVFVTMDNVLKIAYNPSKKFNNYNGPKRYVKITGPENIVLEVKNSSGQIVVDRVNGENTQLTVSSGQIKASNIGGDLILKGSSGNIQAKGVSGSVTCSITSGFSTLEEIEGDLDFSSTSGRLNASHVGGKVNAELTSGSISLDDVGELGEIEISSGNVKATGAKLGNTTHFKGSSGSFSITTPSDLTAFNYDLQASSGSVSVGKSSGGKKLMIQNGASATVKGNISSGQIKIEN
jgi:lia operon protein LiaG